MSSNAKALFVLLSLLPAVLCAETVTTRVGSLVAPDGLKVLDRSEKPDPKTGKLNGLIVFSRFGESNGKLTNNIRIFWRLFVSIS